MAILLMVLNHGFAWGISTSPSAEAMPPPTSTRHSAPAAAGRRASAGHSAPTWTRRMIASEDNGKKWDFHGDSHGDLIMVI